MNRLITLAVAGSLALGACGSDTASGEPDSSTPASTSSPTAEPNGEGAAAAESATSPTTGPASASSPSATDAPAQGDGVVLFEGEGEGVGAVVQNADGTRTVTSAWGEVTVPADPQRVVSVFGYIDFESMLAVGVAPVAAGTQGGNIGSGFAPHLVDYVDGIEPLPWIDGPPVETIAALRPDLIFATSEEEFDVLSDIGATVPSGHWSQDWRVNLRYIAAVLGRVEAADALLADFDARVADISTRLAPVWGDKTVASPQVSFDHSVVSVDTDGSFSVQILDELGATHSSTVVDAEPDSWSVELSMEHLDQLDADILFWQVRQRDADGQPDREGLDVVTANPLWHSLPAVQNDMVFEVDNRPWYFATILAANRMLDDIEVALLS